MNKKSQQGIALIWVIIAGALLITGIGKAASKKTALKVKKFQPEVMLTPTATPTPAPSPSPTPSPSPSPQVLPPDWDPLGGILSPERMNELQKANDKFLKGLQDAMGPSVVELQKNLSKMPSFGKQPEYPGSGYTPPSVDVYNVDLEKFDKAVMESINKINKQTQEEMKKRLEDDIKQAEEKMKSKLIDPREIEKYFKKNPLP